MASAASGPRREQHLLARAIAVEDARKELERRHEVGLGPPALQRLGGELVGWLRRRRCRAAHPTASSCARRERQQVVVVEAEERAFEHGRERQVVFRHVRKSPSAIRSCTAI